MHPRAPKLLEDIRNAADFVKTAKDDPDPAARITDYRRIIAFRNVLIHGYDIIDPAIVWSAIEGDLAPLLKDVQALLHSAG